MPGASGGISYVTETLPCFAKILSGEYAKKSHNGKVSYGFNDKKEYEQLVDGLLPSFRSYFETHSTNSNNVEQPMGHVLVRRASFYLPKTPNNPNGNNEQQRFLSPDFGLAFSLIQKTLETQKPITNDDIGEVIEQVLLLQYGDWPGVYIRTDLNRPELIYVGKSKKNSDRNKGHLNSPLFLSNIIGTPNHNAASYLEGCIHIQICDYGAQPYREGSNTKGLYKFPPGVDAVAELKKLLRKPINSYIMRNVTKQVDNT